MSRKVRDFIVYADGRVKLPTGEILQGEAARHELKLARRRHVDRRRRDFIKRLKAGEFSKCG